MDDALRLESQIASNTQRITDLQREVQDFAGNQRQLDDLQREVERLSALLLGAQKEVIQTPSGVTGFNRQWLVPAVPMGDVPAEEGSKGNEGAFWTTYVADGHTYLQGGTITGGNGGSKVLDDFKIIDGTTGPVAVDGHLLFITAGGKATITDGNMLPGFTLVAASTSMQTAAAIPANHTFTTVADEGDLHREIGRFSAGVFLPAGPPGNLHADGCLGNFSISVI